MYVCVTWYIYNDIELGNNMAPRGGMIVQTKLRKNERAQAPAEHGASTGYADHRVWLDQSSAPRHLEDGLYHLVHTLARSHAIRISVQISGLRASDFKTFQIT